MQDYLLLLFVTIIATMMMLVVRKAVKEGARTEALGFVICAVAGIGVFILALALGQPLWVPWAVFFGVIMGIAYAVGFIMIIFHCFKIGPAGLTLTVNNLGLLWPVAISLIWFADGKMPGVLLIVGFLITLLALFLIGYNSNDKGMTLSRTWIKWVLIGWVWAGISMSAQYLASQYAPANPYAFAVSYNFTSCLILLIIMVARKGGKFRPCEWKGGLYSGLLGLPQLPICLTLLTRMPAAVVFPIAVAGPAILLLLIGHFVLQEHLSRIGWAASILGITGIVLLSLK